MNLEFVVFDVVTFTVSAFFIFLAVCHRRSPRLLRVWRSYRRGIGAIVVALFTVIFAIGLINAHARSMESPGMIAGIQFLRLDTTTASNWLGYCGLACSVWLWTILGIELNRLLLYSAIEACQLRFEKDHAVVCGLGSIGMQLVRDIRADGRTVVVIENDNGNPFMDDARERGAIVLHRDATDDESLKLVRMENAREVFVATNDDAACAEVVARLSEVIKGSNRQHSLHCYALISNSDLANAANRMKLAGNSTKLDVEFILPELLAANQVICGEVLNRLPDDLGDRTPHFVLFGFDDQGQALARQIGELVHLENEKRCRVTVLFENERAAERFRSQYPAFAPDLSGHIPEPEMDGWDLPTEADHWDGSFHAAEHRRSPGSSDGVSFVCNAAYLPMDADPVSDATLEGVEYLLRRDDDLPIIMVCTDDENANVAVAERLRDRLSTLEPLPSGHPWEAKGIPVFVALPGHEALHDAMNAKMASEVNPPVKAILLPFARTAAIFGHAALVRSSQRKLAEEIYNDFCRRRKRVDSAGKPQPRWSELSFWEHHSNLAAAGHASMKARILKLKADLEQRYRQLKKEGRAEPLNANLTPKDMHHATRAEHNRWIAERLLTGWKFDRARDDKRKQRELLIPKEKFDELPEDQRKEATKKDHDQLKVFLDFYRIDHVIKDL